MFKRVFVVLAKLLLFIAVVWLMVMAYWKYTDHVVSSEDLLIYFLFLPVALLLGFFVFRMLWRVTTNIYDRITANKKSPSPAAESTSTDVGTTRNTEIHPPTYVLATAMTSYFGDEGTQVLDALMQEKMRVDIDPEFTQELGYGVRVARVEGLDPTSSQEGTRDTVLRTLALLNKIYAPLEGLLRQAAPNSGADSIADKKQWGVQLHPEWTEGATQHESEREAITPPTDTDSMPLSLGVHIVLPTFFSSAEISLVQSDVLTWLESTGWPEQTIAFSPIQPESEIDYLRQLQTWQQQNASNKSTSKWLLVLSAVSWLDMDLLNDKLQQDALFADRLARGGALIGEAASGMVLANRLPDPQLQLEALTQLSHFTLAQRNKPVDAKGTIEAGLLTEMLADQMSRLNPNAQGLVGVVASGDLHSGRVIELGRWMTDELAQLDFIDDLVNTAEHFGECGACGSVLALMLATSLAQQREGKTLFCANQDASWRALAVVQPMLAS